MKIKLTNRTRNFLMDDLYRERITLNKAKVTLVNDYRIPARKAKQLAKELLKEGIEYWNDDYRYPEYSTW